MSYVSLQQHIYEMDRLTTAQRVKIVQLVYRNNNSVRTVYRNLREDYGQFNRPTERTIRNVVKKFEETGSIGDRLRPAQRRGVRLAENIAAVRESVAEEPGVSIRRRSQVLGFSYGSLWRILHQDLHLHPYKIQLTQELKPRDHGQRRIYADWVLEQQEVDADFSKKVLFSDEAHFQLSGYVNKQNSRIWGDENPHNIHETPLHAEKVTVWCALWSGGVIGPYFFENDQGETVTVDGERYRRMITDYFWHEIEDIDVENMWFQQDGATCHTAGATLDVLRQRFPGRIISRFGDVNWPPRSCDLTPLDFFLWGYVKSRVYVNKPETLQHLKNNIRQVIAEIPPEMYEKVIANYLKRIDCCRRSRGAHLSDIIFHT